MENLAALLQYQAKTNPEKIAYYFSSRLQQDMINFAELDSRVQSIAAALRQRLEKGSRVIINYPPGLDFICVLWACFYSDIVAVPSYPPTTKLTAEKLAKIIQDCSPGLILTTQNYADRLHTFGITIPCLVTENIPPQSFSTVPISTNHLAFLQYTSGSTGDPKGVMLTHANLLSNLQSIQKAFNTDETSVGVVWLPPYHDMGLIGGILSPVFAGFTMHLSSPLSFLENPYGWLKSISECKVPVISGGPNFAYEYCIKRISDQQKATLDLSQWQIAFCGAEPINANCLTTFSEAFSVCGFKKTAFLPCYGLAENTLIVSAEKIYTGFLTQKINTDELTKDNFVLTENEREQEIVSCGYPLSDVKIIDPETQLHCKENKIGEIWINGPSVAQGYWNKPELTRQVFKATIADDASKKEYLRTGDLGTIHQEELYVAGRIKDLMIIRGRNYYPQDIEFTAMQTNTKVDLQSACAYVENTHFGQALILVCEVHKDLLSEEYQRAFEKLVQVILAEHQLPVDTIYFIPHNKIPRTTSGKIRHQHCAELIRLSQLPIIAQYQGATIHLQEETGNLPALEEFIQFSGAKQNFILINLIKSFVIKEEPSFKTQLNDKTDLVELGLSSLMFMELKWYIDEQLNQYQVDVPVEYLYKNSTIEGIAKQLRELILNPTQPVFQFSPALHNDKVVPLAYTQLFFWLDREIWGLRTISARARLQGNLDIKRMEYAINKMLQRQTIFWNKIPSLRPEQIKVDYHYFNLPLLTHQPNGRAFDGDSAKAYFQQMILANVDWDKPPLFKAYIIQLVTNEFDFAFFIPHIIADGGCIEILLREIDHYYRSDTELEPLPANFTDHVYWERERFAPTFKRDFDFWKNYVGTQGIGEFPQNFMATEEAVLRGNLHSFPVDENLHQQFVLMCRQNNITDELGYFVIARLALFIVTQQKVLCIGYLHSGRYDKRLRNVIASLITADLYKLDVESFDTFASLSTKLKNVMLETSPYQNCCDFNKFYPVLKQKWSFPTTIRILKPILNPLFNFYFRKYDIHPIITSVSTEYIVEEVMHRLTDFSKKIVCKIIGKPYQKKLNNKLAAFFNILTSYYQKEPYRLGDLVIEEHSYLDPMNVNFGLDEFYLYLGRGQNQQLLLTINGPINFMGQQEVYTIFIKLMRMIRDNPSIRVEELLIK